MKFYRTKSNTLINLEKVVMIYRDPEQSKNYLMLTEDGSICELRDFTEDDVDRIMDYNDYIIK